MISKIVIIDNCYDCPFFDNEYYSYAEECKKLKRKIQHIKPKDKYDFDYIYPIPDDCPLENKD